MKEKAPLLAPDFMIGDNRTVEFLARRFGVFEDMEKAVRDFKPTPTRQAVTISNEVTGPPFICVFFRFAYHTPDSENGWLLYTWNIPANHPDRKRAEQSRAHLVAQIAIAVTDPGNG